MNDQDRMNDNPQELPNERPEEQQYDDGIDQFVADEPAIEAKNPESEPTEGDEMSAYHPEIMRVEESSSDTFVEPVLPSQPTSEAVSTHTLEEPVRKKSKRPLVFALLGVALVLAATVIVYVLMQQNSSEEATGHDQSATPQTQRNVLGLQAIVVDGGAEYRAQSGDWQALAVNMQVAEGGEVRTAPNGRVVLSFDDGSVLRLDANSQARIDSLATNDIKIAHLSGTVYSRVVESDRSFVVTVDGTSFTALGTAFATTNTVSEKGVQVYQSQVKASEVAEAIAEGKQYYKMNPDKTLKDSVTDIDVSALADNAFLAWNTSEDEKDAKFKDKLGILSKVKEKSNEKAEEKEKKQQAEKSVTEKTKQETEKKTKEKQQKSEKQNNSSKEKVTPGTMSITAYGDKVRWSYTGKAVHGYKMVVSKTSQTPTFGKDHAIYYPTIGDEWGELGKKDAPGTYSVRVCAYTAGTQDQPCIDYSPVVTITKK
ncbi:MAG TPA: FecR family protein [Candidatus Saccharibacteria bacterium]|nr:FecR family protein [Candidatus Saccharibacteria bacterium]HMR38305.1 FecR family protein [Candidatus Saccharibacteria bacterium]